MTDHDCICEGNWRSIVKESEPLIGRRYSDHRGKTWTLFGIVHGRNDYYYGMSRKGEMQLLSCVGSIENFEFDLLPRESND